jgi:hypothetical protein
MDIVDTIEDVLDSPEVTEALHQLVDKFIVNRLLEARQRRIYEYERVKEGMPVNAYVCNDLEEDAFEISRRIEALDLIIDEYIVDHEPYDFDAIEWWDDREGLS